MTRPAPIIAGTLAALVLSGCQPSDIASPYNSLTTGMSLADVQQRLGTGEVVSRDQLPESFRIVYEESEGATYRRWIREAGGKTATLYAGFRDGKLTGERLVGNVEITSGTGEPP